MDWYLRPANVIALARDTSYLFIVANRPAVVLEDVDVDAMSQLLAVCSQPIHHVALREECDDETIDKLVELGILQTGTEEDLSKHNPIRQRAPQKRCRNVVTALTGAVNVVSAVGNLTTIADLFADEVEVILSEGAREFVQPRLYEYYGFRVWTDAFEPAHGAAVPHEHLAMNADLVLVAPASASMLQRLANGECSDLTSLVVAATKAPVVVAPSMNPQMWLYPPITRNVAQLRADGIWVVEPGIGFLVAQRDQGGHGGNGLYAPGLLATLDAVLSHAASG